MRIILRNRHLRRPDRDGEEEIIDELDELIREKVNELRILFSIDNDLIDSLLWLIIVKDLKTGLKTLQITSLLMHNNFRDKYSKFKIM